MGLLDTARHRFQAFITIAGDADDNGLVARDAALVDEFLGHGHFGAARRFRKYSLGAGEQYDRIDDLDIGRRPPSAASVAHRMDHVITIGGVANGDGSTGDAAARRFCRG